MNGKSGVSPGGAGARRLSDKVFEYVVRCITDGTFEPLSPITEQGLARMVGVSPAPVREAMEKLEQHGWIERIPYTGTYVRRADNKRIKDICQLREILELGVLRIVAECMTESQVRELRACVKRLREAQKTKDRGTIIRADADFHRRLVSFADNARMDEIFESVVLQCSGLLFAPSDGQPYLTPELHARITNCSHERVCEAIAARDWKRAERLLTDHIRVGYDTIVKMRELFKL